MLVCLKCALERFESLEEFRLKITWERALTHRDWTYFKHHTKLKYFSWHEQETRLDGSEKRKKALNMFSRYPYPFGNNYLHVAECVNPVCLGLTERPSDMVSIHSLRDLASLRVK